MPLKNKLYRFAYRMLDDSDEAQDAVQEVFIKLWNNRNRLAALNSAEAFSIKIMKNHCLDRIKARRTVSIEQTKSLFFEADEETGVEKQVELKDSLKYIRRLISALPEQQKMIIQLRDIEGYEFDEIEQALDISVNTIRVNLSRARKSIRDNYIKAVNNGTEKSKSFTD
ncbi:MAG: RNA polymerase sigma factor [Bacteroidales bacterium]